MTDGRKSGALRRAVVIAALAGGAVLTAWYWWQLGRPVTLPDAPSDRLACVSYSPYRTPGQTPWDRSVVVDPARIDEDLRALSQRFECVRTYSVTGGLEAVPSIARRYGMQALLGLWIGRDAADNEQEITQGIALAHAHTDTVRAVIVGNEVLLRRELPTAALRGLIERVRRAVPQPVTYADVWEFWLKNPELAPATSFVTAHILPYWEDRPVPVEDAVSHVVAVYEHMRTAFPGVQILIGETGWPSVGRDREGAIPSRVNQARFIREFSAAAQDRQLPYNVVEAFDQPWKRQLEGAVGGYWGLFDASGEAKFPFRGPVIEETRWRWGIVVAAASALAFLVAGALSFRTLSTWSVAALLFAGTTTGGTLAAQVRTMLLTNRTYTEWAVSLLYSVLALGAAWLLARSLAAWLQGAACSPTPAPVFDVVRAVRDTDNPFGGAGLFLGALRFAFLFAAAIVCLLLVFDPRYRDFPLEWFAAPATGFVLLGIATNGNGTPRLGDEIEERLLASGLALAVPLIVWNEGMANWHALAWAGLCWMLAAAVALGRSGGREPPGENQ